MFLIVGLGNPGDRYRATRHNAGFMVLDRLAERVEGASWKEKFRAHWARGKVGGMEMVLLKPQTFMNLSGESLRAAATFFKVPMSQWLVVHDELDLPFGTLRLKLGGGVAGHRGLRSIVQQSGGKTEFLRLRFGIGKPQGRSVESYVLSDFTREESAALGGLIDSSVEMIETCLREGPNVAMNRFH